MDASNEIVPQAVINRVVLELNPIVTAHACRGGKPEQTFTILVNFENEIIRKSVRGGIVSKLVSLRVGGKTDKEVDAKEEPKTGSRSADRQKEGHMDEWIPCPEHSVLCLY